ncbi:TRAP transporter large permease subunit [Suttonella sp. R2A3]|uniref:TRAP transporter large permease n=1 Tax=Suttonella sp. R2A3 TaxID=2908648 RepID=UPI001F2A5B68|nr:TRAP transporter large permease subunit [Suttonella sp. R2A3]UJF24974.1 TRAP transporter large permease subunit [Suttonella sp. R2A3]
MGHMEIAAILLTILFISLAMGLWVSLALLLMAVSGYWLIDNSQWGNITATISWGSIADWKLAPLPMFIWMGEILFRSGLSKNLFDGLSVWLNRIPGKLFHVNTLSCGIFAAVSGSSAATVATVGNITLPQLKRLGYRESFAIGGLGGSGTLGLLIPPSIMMIIYGVAAEVSVSRLFMAGVLPGILLIVLFMGYTAVYCWLNPEAVPQEASENAQDNKVKATLKLLPVVLLIIAVLGSIYTGLASPIEASGLGVLGALVLTRIEGSLDFATFCEGLMAAVRTTAMLLFIIVTASVLTNAMGFIGLPRALANVVADMDLSLGMLIVMLTLLFIVLGCFLDGISVILLTTATILPMVQAAGIDPLWFGIYLVLVVEMSQITPPVGFNLFVLQSLTGRDLLQIARYTLPFFLLMMLAIVLLWFFPEIATWLPTTMTEAQ